ncbi:hypothetical protein BCR34DRAFT_622784 [Clohesyomyces aquaticus]|uniref:HIT-type domain-containing protein n=1 Tax=Clohesyomyces aquaticus TaxID=1231657 RepID=A0A1Y1ZZA4_9PLEO|nr:hypothetical protein BCR34DRAFT_622784 [Clohesyomyces aquaticus]
MYARNLSPTLILTDTSNNNKSKYRCPGCAARTCSLPCYKRHQQWAQCTGKRDPTKYVKKSQLATPAGIDHDYNFITSIERGVDRTERAVQERGLGAANAVGTGPRRGEITGYRYDVAGVQVIKAPKGLSRQRENNTHSSSKRHIVWTVEWLREDQPRILSETSEVQPLDAAYAAVTGQKVNKKRKRAPDIGAKASLQEPQDAEPNEEGETRPTRVAPEAEEAEHSSSGRASPREASIHDGPTRARVEREPTPDTDLAEAAHRCPDTPRADSQPVPLEQHFYLLKPRTNSTSHVLIPLSASATLGECLRGRTVLEYPTLYVLSHQPKTLPDNYVLEEVFLRQETQEQNEFEEMLKGHPEALRVLKNEANAEGNVCAVDDKAILDVLQKDLGSAGM